MTPRCHHSTTVSTILMSSQHHFFYSAVINCSIEFIAVMNDVKTITIVCSLSLHTSFLLIITPSGLSNEICNIRKLFKICTNAFQNCYIWVKEQRSYNYPIYSQLASGLTTAALNILNSQFMVYLPGCSTVPYGAKF